MKRWEIRGTPKELHSIFNPLASPHLQVDLAMFPQRREDMLAGSDGLLTLPQVCPARLRSPARRRVLACRSMGFPVHHL